MKRAWLGAAVLAALLALSLWVSKRINAIHAPLAEAATVAAESALAGDWTRAEEVLQSAAKHWQRHRHTTAALGSHEAVEEVEAFLEQGALYARLRDPEPFAVACQSLAALCQAEQEAQKLTWWNLL